MFSINSGTGQSLTFAKSSGTNSTTLNLTGGAVTTTAGATNVDSGVTLASNRDIAMNVNGATLTNAGTITSSKNNGAIQVLSNGALTVDGTGAITFTGGSGSI